MWMMIGFAFIVKMPFARSQSAEFAVYPNGLIYSETAMQKLGHVVDSLNLRFRNCELNKTFYGCKQTVGHSVWLKEGNISAAQKDMQNNISLEQFLERYPQAIVVKDVLILERDTYVESVSMDGGYGGARVGKQKKQPAGGLSGSAWIFEHNKATKYSKEDIQAFFCPNTFVARAIPERYARMIGYADCLIDTQATKLHDERAEGWVGLPENWAALSVTEKQALLEDMRKTQVVGYCSMDTRPRQHAVNIALLSAETFNWPIFLKAHLDIMNDRFERAADGSYAWKQRNTYIKELEELDIQVMDLLLGISFRIENPAVNHYYGSIGRLGRALAETRNYTEVEQAILDIIQDPALDDYNRIIFCWLFMNYNYYQEDKQVQSANKARLESAMAALPEYIRGKLKTW
ncbi:MAG: hypothetical protein KF690_03495 [Bacteroidetes bacterium]|nr:hypothetical protein [Bacteroidota bacterium]